MHKSSIAVERKKRFKEREKNRKNSLRISSSFKKHETLECWVNKRFKKKKRKRKGKKSRREKEESTMNAINK